MSVATLVLATVNASYAAKVSAHQLAAMITDPRSASACNAVFAFFSEVSPVLQKQFIEDMGVDAAKASKVAGQLAKLSGYALPLAT
ncbi:MAG: hypothetical protein QM681_14650 [Novosphingobium sp.]